MQQYKWKAVNTGGQNFSGVCEAYSKAEAAAFVRSNYGFLTSLQKAGAAKKPLLQSWRQPRQLGDEDKSVLFGQLALMLGSGLPVLKALAVLEERLPAAAAMLCKEMRASLEGGSSLAQAVKKQQPALGELPAAAVLAGEEGGILCELLEELAQYYKLQAQMKRFIKNISLYPLFLLTASSAVAILFIVKLLPMFANLYASLPGQAPGYLTFLFALHGYVMACWQLLLLAAAAGVLMLAHKRHALVRAIFKLPLLKDLRQLYLEIRFCKVLSLLLNGGIALPEAARIGANALGDAVLSAKAENFAAGILRGVLPLEAAMQAQPLFGRLSCEFIAVGAETGRLPEMLARAAELLQYRFDDRLKNLQVVLEPLLLVFVAVFVAAIILAVAAPMFSLADALPEYN